MRSLKFRAWWKGTKRFLDGDEWYMASSGAKYLHYAVMPYNDDDFIIEQYTGLKDKNGKEIYEGDIIKSSEHIGEVYQQGNGRWVIFCGKDKLHDGDLIVVSELEGEIYDLALTLGREYCEVIGNIHDNHELIEKEEE